MPDVNDHAVRRTPHHVGRIVRRGGNPTIATSVSLVMVIPIYLVVVNP